MKRFNTIGIWGDSILKGIIFDENLKKYIPLKYCAVQILKDHFTDIEIKNHARFGNVITKGEAMIRKSIETGTVPDLAIIEFGGNDCDFNWSEVSADFQSEHFPNTTVELYREKMTNIVSMLKHNGSFPVIMNLPPISSDRYFDWFCQDKHTDAQRVLTWLREKNVIYRTQERYSHIADITAKDLNIPLMDIRNVFLGIRDYSEYLCIDGIHLNEKGQAMLGNTMIDELKKIL